jgi:hypothetical protein
MGYDETPTKGRVMKKSEKVYLIFEAIVIILIVFCGIMVMLTN